MECSFMCSPSLVFHWSWPVCTPCNLCMYPRSIPEVLTCAEPDSMDRGWGDQGGGVCAGASLSDHTGEVQTLRSVHSLCMCVNVCIHACLTVCVCVSASMHECVCVVSSHLCVYLLLCHWFVLCVTLNVFHTFVQWSCKVFCVTVSALAMTILY